MKKQLVFLIFFSILIFAYQSKQQERENPIKHVIVLGMENHSYDNLLGYMEEPIGTLNQEIHCNKVGHTKYCQQRGAEYQTEPDPPHSFMDIQYQLYGSEYYPPGNEFQPDLSGFAESYNTVGDPQHTMNVFTPEQVPIISTLAQEFKTCTNWYSAAPTCTEPNKLFYHAATSGGNLNNCWDNNCQGYPVKVNTIQQNLEKEGHTWKIHWQDWNEAFAFYPLNQQKENYVQDDYFEKLFQSLEDGTLADYSFLIPRGLWPPNTTEEQKKYEQFRKDAPNDQHPSGDIRSGEELIKTVYEKLRASQYWENTLLVISYDEHGGFYDHKIPPSNVKNPNPELKTIPNDFDWNRLGLRVPGIIISPWLAKGVDSTQYEHASLTHTLKYIFNLSSDYLNIRDEQSNSFFNVDELLENPRTDCPMTLPEIPLFSEVEFKYSKSDINVTPKKQSYMMGQMLIEEGFIDREEYLQLMEKIVVQNDAANFLYEAQEILGYRKPRDTQSPYKFLDHLRFKQQILE